MTTMPSWLIQHLEATGRLDADGVHRAANRGRCRNCRAEILVGLDAEPCGLTARVDPWPIDSRSEFIAIATGRWTYNLVRSSSGSGKACWNIDRRSDYHIGGTGKWMVVAEHQCGAQLPADEKIPANTPAKAVTDECPF